MSIDITREIKDISVELAEYRRALREGHVLRALACLNQANTIGLGVLEKITVRGLSVTSNGH